MSRCPRAAPGRGTTPPRWRTQDSRRGRVRLQSDVETLSSSDVIRRAYQFNADRAARAVAIVNIGGIPRSQPPWRRRHHDQDANVGRLFDKTGVGASRSRQGGRRIFHPLVPDTACARTSLTNSHISISLDTWIRNAILALARWRSPPGWMCPVAGEPRTGRPSRQATSPRCWRCRKNTMSSHLSIPVPARAGIGATIQPLESSIAPI